MSETLHLSLPETYRFAVETYRFAVEAYEQLHSVRVELLIAISIVLFAVAKRSLTVGGGVAAITIGVLCGLTDGIVNALVVFFIVSTVVSKLGKKLKKSIGAYETGRDWRQVLANGGVASCCSLFCFIYRESPMLHLFFRLGAIAGICCAFGDTMSSELGVLTKAECRLITTGTICEKGTNGAVTIPGIGFAMVAGLVIELSVRLVQWIQVGTFATTNVLILNKIGLPICSVFGSLVDSVLGATIEDVTLFRGEYIIPNVLLRPSGSFTTTLRAFIAIFTTLGVEVDVTEEAVTDVDNDIVDDYDRDIENILIPHGPRARRNSSRGSTMGDVDVGRLETTIPHLANNDQSNNDNDIKSKSEKADCEPVSSGMSGRSESFLSSCRMSTNKSRHCSAPSASSPNRRIVKSNIQVLSLTYALRNNEINFLSTVITAVATVGVSALLVKVNAWIE